MLLATSGATACAPDPPSAIVGITTEACDPGDETGSGVLVDAGLVLTAAHVVAGARSITVYSAGDRGRSAPATIVGFDPEMDIAYLAVDGVPGRPMELDSEHVDPGDAGVAYVVRDEQPVAVPIRVRRRVEIRTEDIYIEGETLRPGFELDADIRGGDSGGAVVIDGRVAGVVWARSRRFDERAYAIDAVRGAGLVDEQLRTGVLGPGVDPERCH
jgi:S1-C subfamily serine protease